VSKNRARRKDDPFVTGLRQAWRRGGRPLGRHRDGLALTDAVGPDAANRRHDVARVEALLGGAGALDVTATEGPTGYFGRRTDAAIRKLQRDRRLKVDGLITPKGPTLKALMRSLPRAPVPAFAAPKGGAAVGRDARAANGRLVDAVLKTRGAGIVPKLLADAAAQGPSGQAEVADFFAQLAERNTTRARDMATLVAAERARPDLDDEGEEELEGGESETPDNEPPPRPETNLCAAEAYDVKDAENALAPKARELWEVNNEIRDNSFRLTDLYAMRKERADFAEGFLPSKILKDLVKGRSLKAAGRLALPLKFGEAFARDQAWKNKPPSVDNEIAELEARQAELEAMKAALVPEVNQLERDVAEATMLWMKCKAEQEGADGQEPTA